MPSLSQSLASYVLASRFESIPKEVRHEGARAFLNWVGCALGGSRTDLLDRALAVADRLSGPREATVLGRTERVDIAHAAFLNTLSSSLHAFDDTHLTSIAHPTGPVAAACLAIAEQQVVSGPQFLHALVLGLEIECRMGCVLMEPPAVCSVGRTMTGLVGGIGGAAALARLLPLTQEQLVWAMGIAATNGAGLREGVGSMIRDLPMAQAGRTGVEAALLAQAGFTAAISTLDGSRGFAHMLCTNPNFETATRGLGERYEFMTNAYKPYPAGIVIHPLIDVGLALAIENDLDPAGIDHVVIRVNPDTLAITGLLNPVDGLGAQVSAVHWTAAAMVRRRAGFEETNDAAARDPVISRVRANIRLEGDASIGRDGAAGTVYLTDGRSFTKAVDHCVGSAARPMTDLQLEDKFLLQARPLMSEAAARRIIDFCWRIDQAKDVGREMRGLFAL